MKKKYIILMADYTTLCLWDDGGTPLSEDDLIELNLKFWLVEQIKALAAWYEQNEDWRTDQPPSFDYEKLTRYSIAIAHKIKLQLPDYEILCFDEVTHKTHIID